MTVLSKAVWGGAAIYWRQRIEMCWSLGFIRLTKSRYKEWA